MASRARYTLTEVMTLYGLWDLMEVAHQQQQPGPAFWVMVRDMFPKHTPSSLYTKFRELAPTFRRLDK